MTFPNLSKTKLKIENQVTQRFILLFYIKKRKLFPVFENKS